MFNRIFLVGNLTRDPEVRYLPSGTAVTSFDIAVTEKFRDRNQELRDETQFFRVDTFQRLAETCAQFLKKGRRVLVEGRLRLDTWEGRDGVKRSKLVVRALEVRFIEPRPAAEAAPAEPAEAAGAGGRVAETGRSAATARAVEYAEADVPLDEGVPEQDVSAPSDNSEEKQSTDDDLPF